MRTIPSFYPIISRLAAIALLTAGGLKTHELLTVIEPPWTILCLTAFELLFGSWLLVGLYPRWSRLIAVGCFAVFLNVALLGALEGRASCGCFGKAEVRPWVAVGLDALLFVALLFAPASKPGEAAPRPTRTRWLAFTLASLVVLLAISWPVYRKYEWNANRIATQAVTGMPEGIDADALDRVIRGVEQNHAALHTLVYSSEKVQTHHPVKKPYIERRPARKRRNTARDGAPGAASKSEPVEKKSRHSYKTWVRGDEVRQDCLTHHEGGKGGDILVGSKGKRIQYAPQIRQAWISTAEFPDATSSNPIDLRCAGFHPPLRSIADWLRRCQVLNAGIAEDRTGRKIIRIRARMKKHGGKVENEVTADFLPEMNFMPSRIVYFFLPDGGVFVVTDLDYQQVGSSGAWFPRRVAQRVFIRNTTTDPDSLSGHILSEQLTVKILAFGQGVQDEDFDPILPPKTRLLGDLRTQSRTGDAPVRASQMTHEKPIPIENVKPNRRGDASRRSAWPFAAGMDFLLLGSCLAFRKRLVF